MRVPFRWGVSLLVLLLAASAVCFAVDVNTEESESFVEPAKESKERLPCGGARLFLILNHVSGL